MYMNEVKGMFSSMVNALKTIPISLMACNLGFKSKLLMLIMLGIIASIAISSFHPVSYLVLLLRGNSFHCNKSLFTDYRYTQYPLLQTPHVLATSLWIGGVKRLLPLSPMCE